jgi:hypothetical protein
MTQLIEDTAFKSFGSQKGTITLNMKKGCLDVKHTGRGKAKKTTKKKKKNA